ncbi:DUF4956 domain-containing protein [Adhaeribacter rhizoryzae]|uniref:DUF4956 domain-containing protein n=1 Tax=Adhaeribacter rhizoryzae TaxID=2607907 RepID=A0A5M6DL93_9BACT|nr:DUF4956 domain-containing protein [Adhaeribacter rhizoryzae]KAA5548314.1 DUF4956 domain-containing protein [Adhaeribacter rhizoryzae]
MTMDISQFVRGLIIDNLAGFSYRNIPNFIFSFLVCAILAFLLGKMYTKYGHALSNRKVFSRNFVILALTTMFIISVVKTSLALSLGLVGALSIVRFRSAIKEPEELTYLFLTIAIGLGCGAGLTILTIIAFAGFMIVIWFRNRSQKPLDNQNLYFTISNNNGQMPDLNQVVQILRSCVQGVKLKRLDETEDTLEASFVVDVEDYQALEKARSSLKSQYPHLNLTFVDTTRDF